MTRRGVSDIACSPMAKTKRTSVRRRTVAGAWRRDVLIGGGGFAGLALAIALRQGLGDPFRSSVADPALGTSHAGDARASAIAAAARRLFETIGVWEEVAGDAQPILDMVVTDSKLQDVMRPVFLTFGGEVEPGEPFAHMVENRALVDCADEQGQGGRRRACAPSAVAGFEHRSAIASRSALPAVTDDCRDDCWSPPTARARRSARRPASRASAGTTASPASSPPSRMSATQRPRRGAFPAGRAVRDPAAQGQALVDRVDRGEARGRAHRRAAGRRIPRRAGAALRAASSARSRRSARAAPIRSACRWRARSSPSGSRSSAMPRT